jgi:hypothetical protein
MKSPFIVRRHSLALDDGVPLFQRGELQSPPFIKGRVGGIFKWLNSYEFGNW